MEVINSEYNIYRLFKQEGKYYISRKEYEILDSIEDETDIIVSSRVKKPELEANIDVISFIVKNIEYNTVIKVRGYMYIYNCDDRKLLIYKWS